ncbi:MAG: hypothetical protein ACE5IE_04260, partial [Dehalococcoidia bacterium]
MDIEKSIIIQHKNDISTYLSDWMNMMSRMRPEEAHRYRLPRIPATVQSLHIHTYDLSVVLEYLDSRLQVLEGKPILQEGKPMLQLDYKAYAEARVFLKAFYIFFRILLDDVSGIIEYFYKKNERGVAVTKSFDDLVKNSKKGKLPEGLSGLLEQPSSWFPAMTKRRDDLVHEYESFIISIEQGEDGKNILGYFSIKGSASGMYEDIRKYFGFLLCEYQMLIDNLLDHFDNKFRDWYGIVQGKSGRTLTIMQGCVAFPLWWAYK